MPTQPFTARLALGRSAYAPTEYAETVVTEHYIQLGPNERDLPAAVFDDPYLQVYDARGNPINPRAEDYARRMRYAQNEFQAAIGAIERRPRLSQTPSIDDSASKSALSDYPDEVIWIDHLAMYLVYCPMGSFFDSLKRRILAFGIPEHMSLMRFAISHWRLFGFSLPYAGLPALYTMLWMDNHFFRPLICGSSERLPWARETLRRRGKLGTIVPRAMWFLFKYTMEYHYMVQSLGLLPLNPLLSPWRIFVPFSKWSPLPFASLSLPHSWDGLARFGLEAVTSPLAVLCLRQAFWDAQPIQDFNWYMVRLFLKNLKRTRDLLEHQFFRTGAGNVGHVTNINRLTVSPAHPATQDLDRGSARADDPMTSTRRSTDSNEDTSTSSSVASPCQPAPAAWFPSHPVHTTIHQCISGFTRLPISFLVARCVASHFIRTNGNPIPYGNSLCHFRDPLMELPSITFQSSGRILGKAALCLAMICVVQSATQAFQECFQPFAVKYFRRDSSREPKSP